jgi:hypothetical protein
MLPPVFSANRGEHGVLSAEMLALRKRQSAHYLAALAPPSAAPDAAAAATGPPKASCIRTCIAA